jgi:hypothetical protein
MTRGPLTAYSIILICGFKLSIVKLGPVVDDIFRNVLLLILTEGECKRISTAEVIPRSDVALIVNRRNGNARRGEKNLIDVIFTYNNLPINKYIYVNT